MSEVRPIDANALAEVLNEMIADYTEFQSGGFFAHGIRKGLNDAYHATINFPTLDYAPVVHGEWIRQDETYTRFQCSSCKSENHGRRWLFCTICGAKMEGKKDDLSEKG